MPEKVQRSKEYYEWLYEGGPKPADLDEEEAAKEKHRVLGTPLPSQRVYHPNSIMNKLTPEQRQRFREAMRADSDIDYDPEVETYEQALNRELDKKGL